MIVIANKVAGTAVNAQKTASVASGEKTPKHNTEAAKTANRGRKKTI